MQGKKIGTQTHLGAFNPELEEADPFRLEERGVGLRVRLRAQIPAGKAGPPPRQPRRPNGPYRHQTHHRRKPDEPIASDPIIPI
jgi:hypothetical protein